MQVEQVLESAKKAKAAGSTRFCMGAAWKNPHGGYALFGENG